MKAKNNQVKLTMAIVGILFLIGISSAQGAIVVTTIESSDGVVFTGEGTLNLGAWSNKADPTEDSGRINPSSGVVVVGPVPSDVDRYQDVQNFAGPSSFGSGGQTFADVGFEDIFGILSGADDLIVPLGYISGEALSGLSVYAGATLASLGLKSGTYTWTWGSGNTADSLTLEVVPIPAAVWLLGGGLIGLLGLRKRFKN